MNLPPIKVIILSYKDYAGSGYSMAQLVKRASNNLIDIKPIVKKPGLGNKNFKIKVGSLISDLGEKNVQKLINESDIIHYKGDWPYYREFEGLNIPNDKKIIQTFSGSEFRRPDSEYPASVALGSFPLDSYRGDFLSAITPELCYTKQIHWIALPRTDFKYKFKQKKKFVIMHIPSSPEKKGTDIISEALNLIKRKDIIIEIRSNISHRKSLKLKSSAHIYIDQMILPVYGNAAVEAMSMGIPVMNWDKGLYPIETPIIKPEERTAEAIADTIENWLDWDKLTELSKQTFNYCQDIHGKVGHKWVEVYRNLIS